MSETEQDSQQPEEQSEQDIDPAAYIAADEVVKNDGKAFYEQRNKLLKGMKYEDVCKAWFNLAHLILDDGASVLDVGCGEGELTYIMAAMNPKVKFIGVHHSRRHINKAKEKYQLDNLEYKVSKLEEACLEPESVDAVICSYVLHEIYSGSRYSERAIPSTLDAYYGMLKKGGTLFIRDYACPPDELIQLELMNIKAGKGDGFMAMTEPDLLEWYAEHARPKQDPGCGGFFLEELPSRYPNRRLFRLPYKWAYEFVMRKDNRENWETELPIEYTFYTLSEMRKELRGLGARIQYSGPYWEDNFIDKNFAKSFRLYKDDRTPMGNPPTCFIAVAIKMPQRKSLHIEERRPAAEESKLTISAMRDSKSGRIYDIINRDTNVHEIIPYRITDEGRLKVYLHDGIARSIANAVPRSGFNFDGREWSGHMIEPVAVDDSAIMNSMKEYDVKHTALFAREYLGLKPEAGSVLQKGPDYYTSPEHIDEHVQTYYVSVNKPKGTIMPKSFISYESSFQAKGLIREMDAQQVLNAIDVGLIPNGRLELQLLTLFKRTGVLSEKSPAFKEIPMKQIKIREKEGLKQLLKDLSAPSKRYHEIKGSAGQLRTLHSTFVEEGQTRGAPAGLSAEDVDFFVENNKSINTAVVLPLAKNMEKEIHAAFQLDHLPVPQRHNGKPGIMTAPSFNLPPHITNQDMARQFVAERYGVTPDMILKLGESYYSNIGLTPQRIYIFGAVTPVDAVTDDPMTHFLPFKQLKALTKLVKKDAHFMKALFKAYKYLDEGLLIRQDSRYVVSARKKEAILPDWELPSEFAPSIFRPEDVLENYNADMDADIAAPDPARMYKSPMAMPKFDAADGFNTVQRAPEKDIDISADINAPAADDSTYVYENVSEEELDDELLEMVEKIEKQQEEYQTKPQPEKW